MPVAGNGAHFKYVKFRINCKRKTYTLDLDFTYSVGWGVGRRGEAVGRLWGGGDNPRM